MSLGKASLIPEAPKFAVLLDAQRHCRNGHLEIETRGCSGTTWCPDGICPFSKYHLNALTLLVFKWDLGALPLLRWLWKTPGQITICNGKITIFNGKIHYKWTNGMAIGWAFRKEHHPVAMVSQDLWPRSTLKLGESKTHQFGWLYTHWFEVYSHHHLYELDGYTVIHS